MSKAATQPATGQTEFDGKCAFAVSVGATENAPDAKSYTLVRDGKTYAFLGPVPKLLFRAIPGSTRRAHRIWGNR